MQVESLESRELMAIANPPEELWQTGAAPVAIASGSFNQDALADLAALAEDGSLLVALNHEGEAFHLLAPQDLGLTDPKAIVSGYFDFDPYGDLAIIDGDRLIIALGSATGEFMISQSIDLDDAAGLESTSPERMLVGLWDGDLQQDVLLLLPGSSELMRLSGAGDGTFTESGRWATGKADATSLAAVDLIEDSRRDVVVGHTGGELVFFEGTIDAGLARRNDLLITGLGSITALASSDVDDDGDADLLVAATDRASVVWNDGERRFSPIVANGDFSQALTGWATTEGAVTGLGGVLELREGSSLLTTAEQTFAVPAGATTLSFDILGWRLESPAGRLPDAFEASLLNVAGESLVPAFRADATSFFNLAADRTASHGSGVEWDGTRVTLDVSGIAAGTVVTLYLDLIGLPEGTTSSVRIDDVVLPPLTDFRESFTRQLLTGPFADARDVVVADMDGDGVKEIVIADDDRLVVFEQSNLARSEAALPSGATGSVQLAVGRFTRGESDDLAVAINSPNGVLTPLTVDQTAPTAALASPAGGTSSTPLSSLVVSYSEAMRVAETSGFSILDPAAYELRSAGLDGEFDTLDDETIEITGGTTNLANDEATLTLAESIGEGLYRLSISIPGLTALAADLAGNLLGDGEGATFIITVEDVELPPETGFGCGPMAYPTITGILRDDGSSNRDGVTSDRTLVLVGTAVAGSTVTINRAGVGAVGTTLTDKEGNWRFDYTGTFLAEGEYSFTATSAGLGPLGVATGFNLFIFDDLTHYGTDVGGRVAAGGDAAVTTYGIGTSLSNSNGGRDDLVVEGDLNYANGQVYSGNVVVGGTASLSSSTSIPNGSLRQESVIDFDAVQDYLQDKSASFAAKTANGTVTNLWGGLTLQGTDADLNVFDLPVGWLNSTWGITFDVPAGSSVLVNIAGGTAQMQYLGMTLGNADPTRIIWNFHEATSLTLQGLNVKGTILAPYAAVQFSNGAMDGTLVAKSFTGQGELHHVPLTVTCPSLTSAAFEVTIEGPTSPSPKFLVADGTSDEALHFSASGSPQGSFALPGSISARGIVSNAAGDSAWVLDSSGTVWVFDLDGSLRGSWQTTGLANPTDIALNGDDLWIVDAAADRAYRFAKGTTFRSGAHGANDSFALHTSNTNGVGLAARSGQLWVVDDGPSSDEVFVYSTAGEYLGQWTIDGANGSPTGITVDPTGGQTVWIVDHTDLEVYVYENATGWTSGSHSATSGFDLGDDAVDPQGIADPPGDIIYDTLYSDSISVAGQIDEWYFTADVGDRVWFDKANTANSSFFQLEIVDSDGDVIWADDFANYLGAAELTEAGDYTLRVFAEPGRGGNYQFRLWNVPLAEPASITFGDPIEGELAKPGERLTYTFDATTGDRVSFALDASHYSVGIRVFDPAGTELMFEYGYDYFELASDGEYTVTVESSTGHVGDFELLVDLLTVPTPSPIEIGEEVSGEILLSGARYAYEFSGTVGQTLVFDMLEKNRAKPTDFEAYWELYDPEGNYFDGGDLADFGPVELALDGTYKLVVGSEYDWRGEYRFVITELEVIPPVAIELDEPVTGTFPAGFQNQDFTFEAEAGQIVFVDAQAGSGSWALYGPDGSELFARSFADDEPIVLPESGVYTLQASGEGDYQFVVWDVPPSTPTLIVSGQIVDDEIGVPGEIKVYSINVGLGDELRFEVFEAGNEFSGVVFTVEDSEGNTVWPEFTSDRPTITTTVGGTYTITVDNRPYYDYDGTPSFEFAVYVTSLAAATPIDYREPVLGSLDEPGEIDVYSFEAVVGDVIVHENGFVGGPTMNYRLFDSAGNELSYSVGLPFTIPESGTYKLYAQAGNASLTGDYAFRVWDRPADVPQEIDLDEAVSGTTDIFGQTQTYTFTGTAGQSIYLDLLNGGVGFHSYTLTGPGGVEYFADSAAEQSVVLATSGEYTLVVQRGSNFGESAYGFTLVSVPISPPQFVDLGHPVVGETNVTSERQTFTFGGIAGHEIYLNLLKVNVAGEIVSDYVDDAVAQNNDLNPFPGHRFTVYGPDDDVLVVTTSLDRSFVLPTTGAYRVVVERVHSVGVADAAERHFGFQVLDLHAPTTGAVDSQGTDFWLAFPGHMTLGVFGASGPLDIRLYITSEYDAEGTVTIPEIGFGAAFSVSAGEMIEVVLPAEYITIPLGGITLGTDRGAGVHITADKEISVSGLSHLPATGDAFLALPTDALGTEYIVGSYRNQRNFTFSQFSVVATEDNTTVTIAPSATAERTGTPTTVVLMRGQTYQYSSSGDVTGTVVTSDKPVAVMAGHSIANVPSWEYAAGNYLIEQLAPVSTWGDHFVTVPLANRSSDLIRVVAAFDATDVIVNGTTVAALDRGECYEWQQTGPAEIVTTQRAMAIQFSNSSEWDDAIGDPMMMVLTPVEQFLSEYTLQSIDFDYVLGETEVTPFTQHWLNLVLPEAAFGTATLDGELIDLEEFTEIGATGYYAATLSVEGGSHHLTASTAFGISVYGFGLYDAYGYSGGMSLSPIPGQDSLTLSPRQTQRLQGASQVFVASLRDADGGPQVGETVTFTVTGVHPQVVEVTTNSLGLAVFTLTSTEVGADLVTATAGSLSTLSTVNWGTAAPIVNVDTPAGPLAPGQRVVITGDARSLNLHGRIVQVLVNGRPVNAIDATGRFWFETDLAAGTNAFNVVAIDQYGAEGSGSLHLNVTAPTAVDPTLDWDDVTPLGQVGFVDTTYNRHTGQLLATAELANTSTVDVNGPIVAVFDNFTAPSVDLAASDRTVSSDRAAIDFDVELGDGLLEGDETSTSVALAFTADRRERFVFDVTLYAPGNHAPRIVSAPTTAAEKGAAYHYEVEALDVDGDELTFSLVQGPAGMTVDEATGVLAWTPAGDQTGEHQIRVRVEDGRGGETIQTYWISVGDGTINHPPVFTSAPIVQIAEGEDYAYQPTVFDLDGDDLSYSLVDGPDGMTIDADTGAVSYADAVEGVHEVEIEVSDGRGGVARQAFYLTVGDGPVHGVGPRIVGVPPGVAAVDELYAYTPQLAESGNPPLVFVLLDPPEGMTINGATGEILWTPTTTQIGPQIVTLAVADALGNVCIQSFVVDVRSVALNRAPIITSTPGGFASAGDAYTYQVDTIDPDGNVVQCEVVAGPTGLEIDEDGLVTWAVPTGAVGPHRILLRAFDAFGGESFQEYYLQVRDENEPPVWVTEPSEIVVGGKTFCYASHAVDSEDGVAYSIVAAPGGATINRRSGVVIWKTSIDDVGEYTFTLAATDDRGLVTLQTFTLDVTADTSPPTVEIIGNLHIPVGSTSLLQVAAADDAGVETVTLSIDGELVELEAGNIIDYLPTSVGVYTLVATATDGSGNVTTTTARLVVYDAADDVAPIVDIAAPLDQSLITYLTDVVGTVTDDNLESFVVQVSLAGANQWTTIAKSYEGVSSDYLATFDPTLLRNDRYDIRVVARDLSGNVGSDTIEVEVTGDAKIGVFNNRNVDADFDGVGIPFELKRVYNTMSANVSGDLGYGWYFCGLDGNIRETVPYGQFETLLGQFAAVPFKEGDRIYISTPDCQRVGFTFKPIQHTGIWSLLGDSFYEAHWEPDPGVEWELYGEFDRVNLRTQSFDLQGLPLPLVQVEDGSFVLALNNVAYNPLGYMLVDKAQTQWHYSQFDGLVGAVDRNGNTITVTDDGIFSSSGESILFQRDDQGRVTQVTNPNGGVTKYTYNDSGEISLVEYPSDMTTTFDYEGGPAHFLTSINADGDENSPDPEAHLRYNLANRFSQIFDGLGASNRMEYDLDEMTERVYDAMGHATEMEYDVRGNMVRQSDPLGATAYFAYDANDKITSIIDARGSETTFEYDERGNVTSFTDELGNTTSFTYTDRNQFLTQTDALGATWHFTYDGRGNLITMDGPLDAHVGITYDMLGRPTSFTNSDDITTQLVYAGLDQLPNAVINADETFQLLTYYGGKLKTFTDENGSTTTFEYEYGQVVKIIDELAQETNLTYRGRHLESITDQRGNTTQFVYDAAGRPIRVIDAEGNITRYTYNANGDRTSVTDAMNRTTTYVYRDDRRLESVTDADGKTTSYEYDGTGNVTAVIDANGNRWETTYDANNLVLTETDPLGNTWTNAYDAVGNLISTTDPNGNVTTYTYDALYRLTSVIDALENETLYEYDGRNNVVSVTNALGDVITNVYDDRNRLIEEIDALGSSVEYTYDGVGNVTSMTDGRYHVTTYVYDELRRLVERTDATNAVTSYVYGANNLLLSETDARDVTTTYEYDDLDRLIRQTDSLEGVWEYSYDDVGNQLTATDPLNRTTTYAYDDLNRLISVTDPALNATTYTYDAVGLRTSVTDPLGNVTQYVYNDANRLIQRIDPLLKSSYYSYDAAGNLTEMIDRNGRITEYSLDELNRIIEEMWRDGGDVVNVIESEYDEVSNRLSAHDFFSSYTFEYDVEYRLKKVDNDGTPGAPHVVLNYQYDAAGNRTQTLDSSGVKVQATFDSRNQLETLLWSGGGVDPARADFAYDARGQRTLVERYADLAGSTLIGSTTYQYDDLGRLTELSHRDPLDAALVDYDYVRDFAGQLLEESHHGQTTTYQYDSVGQLTSADHSTQTDETYTYDDNGNRISGGNVVGDNNQLLSDGVWNYEYDDEGNLVLKTNIATGAYTTYEFDHRNRLVSGTEYSSSDVVLQRVSYVYDMFDRMIARTVDEDGAGSAAPQTRYTVYDGENVWADFGPSGGVIARYLAGDRTDELIARWRPGEGTAWYLTDNLGTVRDIADEDGDIVNHIDYDSFGNILSQTNAAFADRFTYTGREWDPALGLYYHRARFYDPRIGRFISQDPLSFVAGDSNLYRYVGNHPTIATDPSGMVELTECAIVRGLNMASGMVCTVMDMWATDSLNSDDPEVLIENTFSLLNETMQILGGPAAMVMQFTMTAMRSKTAMDVISPFAGPLANVGMQIHGIYDSFMAAQTTGLDAAFWVNTICTAVDFGMMVWSANSRCFVAGTPVVIAYGTFEGEVVATDAFTTADWIGGAAVVVAAMATLANVARRNDDEQEDEPLEPKGGTNARNAATNLLCVERRDEPREDATMGPQRSNQAAAPSRWSTKMLSLIAAFACLVAGVCLAPRAINEAGALRGESVAQAALTPVLLTKPIEQIRLGERVLAHNPELDAQERLAPQRNWATYRKVELSLAGDDGRTVRISLLRPLDWITAHRGFADGTVAVDLGEIGISGDAALLSVSECPPIQPGDGSVVTGTFQHTASGFVELRLRGERGPLVCTTGHLFWSSDRQLFVAAEELRVGEALRGADGRLYVADVVVRSGSEPVFNLEVDLEHVYYVGERGVLTHNSTASCTGKSKGIPVEPTVTRDANQRIVKSEAVITYDNLYGGTGTTEAARALTPGDDAGHIIGRLLGGRGGANSDNIFAQLPAVNRGDYRVHEAWVADQVRNRNNTVKVEIELIYPDATASRPSGILYRTIVNGGEPDITRFIN